MSPERPFHIINTTNSIFTISTVPFIIIITIAIAILVIDIVTVTFIPAVEVWTFYLAKADIRVVVVIGKAIVVTLMMTIPIVITIATLKSIMSIVNMITIDFYRINCTFHCHYCGRRRWLKNNNKWVFLMLYLFAMAIPL